MTTAADVLRRARAEIGTKETPRASNKQKYGAWYGMNGQPWCAMFVSWVMHQSGVDLRITTDKGFAYCPYGVSWFKARGLWRNSRLSKPGDVVFYNFHGGNVAEHVGIVVGNKALAASLTAIEGNTGLDSDANGGQVMSRVRSRSFILGTGNMQGFYTAPVVPKVPSWRKDNPTHPQLSWHDQGQPVRHMQSLLLRSGANIVVDGVFGRFTSAALEAFQLHAGLHADKVCGPLTWEALHN